MSGENGNATYKDQVKQWKSISVDHTLIMCQNIHLSSTVCHCQLCGCSFSIQSWLSVAPEYRRLDCCQNPVYKSPSFLNLWFERRWVKGKLVITAPYRVVIVFGCYEFWLSTRIVVVFIVQTFPPLLSHTRPFTIVDSLGHIHMYIRPEWFVSFNKVLPQN